MKTKLLLISAIAPFPQTSGGATRIFHTIKELSKQYDIDLITFSSKKQINIQKYVRSCKLFNTQPNNYLSLHSPFWFSVWYNQNLIQYLKKLFQNSTYKLIQIEFSQLLYLSKYLPKDTYKIFVSHDISTISFWRRLKEKVSLKTIVHILILAHIYLYEFINLLKFDKIVAVSQKDVNILKKLFFINKSELIPNGIDKIDLLSKNNNQSYIKIGYIGSIRHTPNKYAMEYLFNKIRPLLVSDNINYKFIIAGDNKNKDLFDLIKNNQLKDVDSIINLGYIQRNEDFYNKIDVLMAPIFSGSGSRIKILESLSYGVPVITSTIGIEGIDLKNSYIQIANQPYEYLKKLQDIKKINIKDTNELIKDLKKILWSNILKKYNIK